MISYNHRNREAPEARGTFRETFSGYSHAVKHKCFTQKIIAKQKARKAVAAATCWKSNKGLPKTKKPESEEA